VAGSAIPVTRSTSCQSWIFVVALLGIGGLGGRLVCAWPGKAACHRGRGWLPPARGGSDLLWGGAQRSCCSPSPARRFGSGRRGFGGSLVVPGRGQAPARCGIPLPPTVPGTALLVHGGIGIGILGAFSARGRLIWRLQGVCTAGFAGLRHWRPRAPLAEGTGSQWWGVP
jgi:hypothetical protein